MHPLNLGKISVVDFPFPHTYTLKGFLTRAHQRQSKSKKCKFVELLVLLGRSLTSL